MVEKGGMRGAENNGRGAKEEEREWDYGRRESGGEEGGEGKMRGEWEGDYGRRGGEGVGAIVVYFFQCI